MCIRLLAKRDGLQGIAAGSCLEGVNHGWNQRERDDRQDDQLEMGADELDVVEVIAGQGKQDDPKNSA